MDRQAVPSARAAALEALEDSRTERVFAAIEALLDPAIQARIVYTAFKSDNDNCVLLMLEDSEGGGGSGGTDGGNAFNVDLVAYHFYLNETQAAEQRALGNPSLLVRIDAARDPLADKMYGCELGEHEGGDGTTLRVHMKAFRIIGYQKLRPVLHVDKDGRGELRAHIDGRDVRLQYGFTHWTPGLVPSIELVNIHGSDIQSGVWLKEVIVPDMSPLEMVAAMAL